MTTELDQSPAPKKDGELEQVLVKDQTLRRLKSGYPWVFRADIAGKRPEIETGTIVDFVGAKGLFAARGFYNASSQLIGRALTRYAHEEINLDFWRARLQKALAAREALYDEPYYRLIHAESDGFPGMIVDRYGDVLVVQINTSGMDRVFPQLQDMLIEMIGAKAILMRSDTSARASEGLKEDVRLSHGKMDDAIVNIVENGVKFAVDLVDGQKTGWFFDQRDNRAHVAELSKGKTMIDIFCHTGGFGITALAKGATSAAFADSSEKALDDAQRNAVLNGFDADDYDFIVGKAFDTMQGLAQDQRTFDVVCVDPPAFIKSHEDRAVGLHGYEKLAKLSAPLVAPKGHLFFASCSHHASMGELIKHVKDGIRKSGRKAELIRTGGAGKDHPVHPLLAETGYLKALTFQFLD